MNRLIRKLGLAIAEVRQVYRELRALERQTRDWDWTLRRRVWEQYAYSRGSIDFWRHGMHARFPRAFGEGDRTLIPRWDETAAELALEFPELAVGGDPSERLFELIRQPYEPLAPAETIWRQAIDLCLMRRPVGKVPF